MKPALSLEEEKRLLLEQLESSRAVYRRMLTNTEEEPVYREAAPVIYDGYTPVNQYPRRFPQSQTIRWIMRNPYLFAAGAVALAVIGKKGLSKSATKPAAKAKSQPQHETHNNNNATLKKGIAATTLGTSLATTAAMVLRNPAQMQAAMRAIGVAVNYYKSRRRDPRARFE